MTTKEQMRQSDDNELTVLDYVMICISLLLLSLAVYTGVYKYRIQPELEQQIPEVVVQFLDEVKENNFYCTTTIVSKYFYLTEETDDAQRVADDFNLLFSGQFEYHVVPSDYAVVQSCDGYIELRLYDSNGTAIKPNMAFLYTLSKGKSKIARYTIARLQPFSKYDEEYEDGWNY